ncbi:hypothetical protein [Xenophilus sp. Marseille-Q4582]|uniref:hypothetical protein n=1 Tax=Xenophilus sp. Marseille-Q4582 TaxID=2866600 RepID=UPI001CE3F7A5|nr:hypothetical protein [Xenophilus sp. Marseille-Q4582]
MRAKGWRFEIDYEQVEQSDTWDVASEVPMAQHALLFMWMTAWTQVPCGSLPADEDIIRAKCRIPAKLWPAMRPVLMRGWWQAEDGRLYHDTIVKRVGEMLEYRRKEAERRNRNRVKPSPVPPMSRGTNAGDAPDTTGTPDTGTGTGTLPSTLRAEGSARPTPGEACIAMKGAGMAVVSPSSPKLLALLEAGITLPELVDAARDAVAIGKPFAYALATAEGRRRDAAVAPLPAARRSAANAQSFAERDRDASMARWEEMTGRVHPDRQPGGAAVIDITPTHQRLEAP